jgi:hypothetical protein
MIVTNLFIFDELLGIFRDFLCKGFYIQMLTNKSSKIPFNFECVKCNYRTSSKKDYNKHLSTAKHKKLTNLTQFVPQSTNAFVCNICNKVYKSRMGLWQHTQKCQENKIDTNEKITEQSQITDMVSSDIVMQLIKENQEFKTLLVEQNKLMIEQQEENQKLQSQLIEAVKDSGNTYNNNNNTINNNQKFNLNFFLNTTCKDAMNMSDFIENMEINFKDIENIGKNGYVNGMTEMILSRIKELDVTKRPLHCTDLKRETMYIKDNDEWCKDTPENTKLRKTIGYVAKRNYATIPLWREKYPECQNWNNPKYDFCVDMMRNILGDIGEKQTRLDNKVIKNLSKHITVDKNQ